MKKTIAIFLISLLCAPLTFSFDWDTYTFYSLKNEPVTYKTLTSASERTIIFLWTTWCYYCRNELKRINAAPLEYEGIKIYYVNLGETRNEVSRLSQRMDLKSSIIENILIDKESALAYKFKVIGVPLYVFFKDGELIHKTHFITDELVREKFPGLEAGSAAQK